ncbi:MAG: hypothetical protein LBJ25_03250 [Candidatus Margulisbacteria bacterium]|jgi:hypothetical protein|nr:hypothetical protein [Candidatus Margulisiibacteriota bacterium]
MRQLYTDFAHINDHYKPPVTKFTEEVKVGSKQTENVNLNDLNKTKPVSTPLLAIPSKEVPLWEEKILPQLNGANIGAEFKIEKNNNGECRLVIKGDINPYKVMDLLKEFSNIPTVDSKKVEEASKQAQELAKY